MDGHFWAVVKDKKSGRDICRNSETVGTFLLTPLIPKKASLEIEVFVKEKDNSLIFRSDKKGNVFPVAGEPDGLNFVNFRRNIGIGTAFDGSPVTLFPDNKLNVVRFGPNCLDLYQVAVVARRGKFYLVISKMAEEAEIFWDENGKKPVCPRLSKWEELGSFISKHYGNIWGHVSQIYRPIEDYQLEVFPLPAGYDEGVVEFYDPARGFGLVWIKADDGTRVPARAFWSEIEGEPLTGLRRGQVVSFESLTESPTSSEFDFELHGVKVVAEK